MKKQQSDGDPMVEKILAEHRGERIQSAFHDLRSKNRDQRAMAVATLITSEVPPDPAVAALLAVVDDEDEPIAKMARNYIQSHTWKPRGLLVDFYADWCYPCRKMQPVVQELQEAGYPVVQVDVKQHRDLKRHFYVTSIPTFAVIVDGIMRERKVGEVPRSDLLEMIKRIPREKKKDQKKSFVTDPKLKVYGLLLAMSAENPWVQYEAVQQLVSQSETTLPQLIQILRNPQQSKTLRKAAMDTLDEFMKLKANRKPLLATMHEIMTDPKESEEFRGMAVIFLSRYDPKRSSEVDEKLVEVLKTSPQEELRIAAAKEIGSRKIVQGLPILLEKYQDRKAFKKASQSFQIAVLFALGDFGAQADAAVPQMLADFRSALEGNAEIYITFGEVLPLICPDSKTAPVELVRFLDDENEEVRDLANDLLDESEYLARAAPALQKRLSHSDLEVRKKAAILLNKTGQPDSQLIPALIGLLDAEEVDWETKNIFLSRWRESIPELVKVICDEKSSERMKINAAALLVETKQVPRTEEQAALQSALRQPDETTRLCAAIALSTTDADSEKRFPLLMQAIKSDNTTLRLQGIRELGNLRERLSAQEKTEVVSALIDLLADKDEEIRGVAANNLAAYRLSTDELNRLIGLLETPDMQPLVVRVLSRQPDYPPAVAEALCKLLREADLDEQLVYEVSRLLGRAGKPALDSLKKLLSDTQVDVVRRVAAVQALGKIAKTEPSVVPLLNTLLKEDQTEELRIAGAVALVGKGQDLNKLLPVLLAGIQSKDLRQKASATWAFQKQLGIAPDSTRQAILLIEKMKPEKRNTVIQELSGAGLLPSELQQRLPSLIQSLSQPEDHYERRRVVDRLVAIDSAGNQTLKLLQEPDENLVQNALSSLNGYHTPIPEPVIPQLKQLLKSSQLRTRLLAALCLLKMDSSNESLRSIVREALHSHDQELLQDAIFGLEDSGKLDAYWAPDLIQLLKDPDTRLTAIEELSKMGPAAKPALPTLIDLLDALSYDWQSIKTLGELGETATPAIPALRARLTNTRLMREAAEALAKIEKDHRPTIAILARNLDNPDLRGESCTCLTCFADTSPEAVEPLLLKVVRSKAFYDRGDAIRALASLKTKTAVNELVQILGEDDEFWSANAAYALQKQAIEADLVVPALIKALDSPKQRVRNAAAYALGAYGAAAEAAMPALLKALDDEKVRWSAAVTLGKIGVPAEAAIPRLINMLEADQQSRLAALKGLETFGPLAKAALSHIRKQEPYADGYELRLITEALKSIEKPEEKQE
ncbi:HEAT repeat domain-containing protein [Gimesia panareensis]|uniref:HEAT repeat domain-containing protein n=1 Tax=Gimesia panareensis TaxID=2527978 RepID=UPI0018D5E9B6|nr:HEAT repeat domain-containing protein [Gimesia panareensis]